MGSIKKQGGLSLTVKFMSGLGIILLCAILVFSFLIYSYLKKMYIQEAYEKTDIVLGYIDATMAYARDELRPQIFHVLPGNIFIRQVMSSTFMNRAIMRRFKQGFPRYIYRRVALDPMNPTDKADAFEEGYIRQFRNAPSSSKKWKGLITRNGEDYFLHLKAIVMEEECLLCHGDPASSPESITRHYGKVNGRHWKVGEVIGLESIAAPVSGTFRKLRNVAFSLFLLGVAGMIVLFAVLNYFHYRVAVLPMKRMSSFFTDVVNGHRDMDIHFDERGYYELSELAGSFNRMMEHLKTSDEERNQMWERVCQADKLASVGRLAAGVAHEINNPLSMILGYTNLLRKECQGDRLQAKEDLDIIYNNANACKKIVQDLLNLYRQTKVNSIPTDLNMTIQAAVASLEDAFKEGGITILQEYDTSLPNLAGDEDKLKIIFTNLLLNSFQAMKPGGCITVKTEFDREGNGARIIISDTGCGIPEGIRDKIFEPFFTTKPPGQGTGLGLAVSYGIVRDHKGRISVKSEEGAGTSFIVWLPFNGDKT